MVNCAQTVFMINCRRSAHTIGGLPAQPLAKSSGADLAPGVILAVHLGVLRSPLEAPKSDSPSRLHRVRCCELTSSQARYDHAQSRPCHMYELSTAFNTIPTSCFSLSETTSTASRQKTAPESGTQGRDGLVWSSPGVLTGIRLDARCGLLTVTAAMTQANSDHLGFDS